MPKHDRPTLQERYYVCVESSPGLAAFSVCSPDGTIKKPGAFLVRPYRFVPSVGQVVYVALEYLPTKAKPLPPRMFVREEANAVTSKH